MNVIHLFCSQKREISRDFFPLLTDAPSEDRNITSSNNEKKLNFSNATLEHPRYHWHLGGFLILDVQKRSMWVLCCLDQQKNLFSDMLVSVVPSHNMPMKFTRQSYFYMSF